MSDGLVSDIVGWGVFWFVSCVFIFHSLKFREYCRVTTSAVGATEPNLSGCFARSSNIGAGVQHSWQSLWSAGRRERALPCVLLVMASLSGDGKLELCSLLFVPFDAWGVRLIFSVWVQIHSVKGFLMKIPWLVNTSLWSSLSSNFFLKDCPLNCVTWCPSPNP